MEIDGFLSRTSDGREHHTAVARPRPPLPPAPWARAPGAPREGFPRRAWPPPPGWAPGQCRGAQGCGLGGTRMPGGALTVTALAGPASPRALAWCPRTVHHACLDVIDADLVRVWLVTWVRKGEREDVTGAPSPGRAAPGPGSPRPDLPGGVWSFSPRALEAAPTLSTPQLHLPALSSAQSWTPGRADPVLTPCAAPGPPRASMTGPRLSRTQPGQHHGATWDAGTVP